MPSNELSRTVGDYFSSLNLGERSSEISSCFERNILLYNLFDRRNRNSSLKTRSIAKFILEPFNDQRGLADFSRRVSRDYEDERNGKTSGMTDEI